MQADEEYQNERLDHLGLVERFLETAEYGVVSTNFGERTLFHEEEEC